MDPGEAPVVPGSPSATTEIRRRRTQASWAAAGLVLLLAVSLGIATAPSPRLRHIRSLLLSPTSSFLAILRRRSVLAPPAPWKTAAPPRGKPVVPPSASPPCVLWMAPFLSGGGYSSEAWSYITALSRIMEEKENPPIRLAIDQHGDMENPEFWAGLPETDKSLARRLYASECPPAETVVICHSEPGAWAPPLFQTVPCPPGGAYAAALAVVGRTMFETDRVDPEHVRRCNRMDAVWVPTKFNAATFVGSGVEASKVAVVAQPVDVDFFNPSRYRPLTLPSGDPVLPSARAHRKGSFVFLSIFKWERRKGWDLLLESFLQEFSAADGVSLYILTNPFHGGGSGEIRRRVSEFVSAAGLAAPEEGWAPVYLLEAHVPQVDLPRLYKAADAFVLPSRGEGWGRPLVEAMAMELPVIATNWSGPTEFLTAENGYPLPVDRMSAVAEGPFKGHLWAEPSATELRALMRSVASSPEEARRRGRRAREDMARRFSPEVVARQVVDQVLKVSRVRQPTSA